MKIESSSGNTIGCKHFLSLYHTVMLSTSVSSVSMNYYTAAIAPSHFDRSSPKRKQLLTATMKLYGLKCIGKLSVSMPCKMTVFVLFIHVPSAMLLLQVL